jgi:hypothetical protein
LVVTAEVERAAEAAARCMNYLEGIRFRCLDVLEKCRKKPSRYRYVE